MIFRLIDFALVVHLIFVKLLEYQKLWSIIIIIIYYYFNLFNVEILLFNNDIAILNTKMLI